MANKASASWPPSAKPTTVLVPRSSTILPIYARTTISSPGPLVFSILRSLSEYPNWNTFCPRATINSQPVQVPSADSKLLNHDTAFTFHVVMDAAKPSKVTDTQLRVTDISTPENPSRYVPIDILENDGTYSADLSQVWRISWKTEGGFVARGLRSERVCEVVAVSDDRCEFRTWECQGGVLARAVKYYYGDVLMGKFALWCEELKAEAERRAGDGQRT